MVRDVWPTTQSAAAGNTILFTLKHPLPLIVRKTLYLDLVVLLIEGTKAGVEQKGTYFCLAWDIVV